MYVPAGNPYPSLLDSVYIDIFQYVSSKIHPLIFISSPTAWQSPICSSKQQSKYESGHVLLSPRTLSCFLAEDQNLYTQRTSASGSPACCSPNSPLSPSQVSDPPSTFAHALPLAPNFFLSPPPPSLITPDTPSRSQCR